MGLEDEIKSLAEQKLSDPAQFIVDVVVSARKGPKKVLVVVDGDNGVSIDDCAELSREISQMLDESPLIDEAFTLEVSTPGLDQPLKLKRQYAKNIGRRLKVKLADKIEEGKLDGVSDEAITLITETGSGKKKESTIININFSQIEKAFVLVSFK
jgi:ribosome maturation factor RimP